MKVTSTLCATVSLLLSLSGRADILSVYPTGSVNSDTDVIQNAIDAARPGDVVLLKSVNVDGIRMPFVLGKLTSTDVLITTATGAFLHMQDFLLQLPDRPYSNKLPAGAWHQHINIHKPLVIRGDTDEAGRPLTTLTVPPELRREFDPVTRRVSGFQGSIILNASSIVLRDLVLDNIIEPIWAYRPGFTISNCTFQETGFGIHLLPDNRLTYPGFPDATQRVQSVFHDNVCIRCGNGPHVAGSEITLRDNSFDVVHGLGLAILPRARIARSLSLPINWDIVQNNVIEGNRFEMNGNGSAVQVGNWLGGTVRSNVIRDNSIRNCRVDGIWLYGESPLSDVRGVSNTTVEGNVVENAAWPMGVRAARGDTATDNVFKDNVILGGGRPPSIWIGALGQESSCSGNRVYENRLVGVFRNDAEAPMGLRVLAFSGGIVRENAVVNNDYRDSGFPGIREFGPAGATIILAAGTEGNLVFESDGFPEGTSVLDQVIDLGVGNRVIGLPANAVETPGFGVTLQEIYAAKLSPH